MKVSFMCGCGEGGGQWVHAQEWNSISSVNFMKCEKTLATFFSQKIIFSFTWCNFIIGFECLCRLLHPFIYCIYAEYCKIGEYSEEGFTRSKYAGKKYSFSPFFLVKNMQAFFTPDFTKSNWGRKIEWRKMFFPLIFLLAGPDFHS